MANELNIPVHLWDARDAAVAGFLLGQPDKSAEKALEEWLLSDDSYSERMEGDDAFGMLCGLIHDDCEIRAQLELDDAQPLDDAERIKFARELTSYIRENGNDATHIDARLLSDTMGRQVTVGLSSLSGGQGGMIFQWLGLFKDQNALIESLHKAGCAVESFLPNGKTFDHYTEHELLDLMKQVRT